MPHLRADPPPDPPAPGMRERKKERTREAIVRVALQLFEEKGFDAATVEEIAAAADISPRTFFRYFTSKEDVVFLGQDEENAMIVELLRARPPDEPPLDWLLRVTRLLLARDREMFGHVPQGLRLIQRTPALRARRRQALEEMQDILANGLMSKRPSKAEALRLRVLVASYLAAVNEVMTAWIVGGAKGDPRAQLDLVEEVLRRGFR
jgi:AcrR family transcriptional regulator